VIKFYAKDYRYQAAATGLRISQGLGSVLAPRPATGVPEWRLTVQSLLPGQTPADPFGVAERAGALLSALHGSKLGELSALRRFPPAQQLEAAGASARMVLALLPALRPRLNRILSVLEDATPETDRLVMSHGDFSVHQLLELGPELAVTDFDELCLAPAGLDVASYSAYLVRGQPDDLAAAARTMEALLEGYGRRPEAVSWYLATMILRRAPRPFRYVEPDWPDRVHTLLGAAEEALCL
jgi:aminoglycoside phosphotransferase (APT) family kinase protein